MVSRKPAMDVHQNHENLPRLRSGFFVREALPDSQVLPELRLFALVQMMALTSMIADVRHLAQLFYLLAGSYKPKLLGSAINGSHLLYTYPSEQSN
jgi:hypothetical protein